MNIVIFINSKTVNINEYNIKDIPGTSGRLDVISRCILAALLRNNNFERNVQIWIFLDRYGTFFFSSEFFDYEVFPKKVKISYKTNLETTAQIVYGYNYDFIFEERLPATIMDFHPAKEHTTELSNLIPRTSYRFQIRVRDYQNNTAETKYYLVTTTKE